MFNRATIRWILIKINILINVFIYIQCLLTGAKLIQNVIKSFKMSLRILIFDYFLPAVASRHAVCGTFARSKYVPPTRNRGIIFTRFDENTRRTSRCGQVGLAIEYGWLRSHFGRVEFSKSIQLQV